MNNLMIFGAESVIYLAIILMFILGVKGKSPEKKSLILAVIAFPIAVLLIKFIHLFIFEPRPYIAHNFSPLIDTATDASFPSRHTTTMTVLSFPYLLFKSKWTLLFLLLLILVGISRVYVGVHYPIDIIGGLIVGAISLILAKRFLKLIHLRFFS